MTNCTNTINIQGPLVVGEWQINQLKLELPNLKKRKKSYFHKCIDINFVSPEEQIIVKSIYAYLRMLFF